MNPRHTHPKDEIEKFFAGFDKQDPLLMTPEDLVKSEKLTKVWDADEVKEFPPLPPPYYLGGCI